MRKRSSALVVYFALAAAAQEKPANLEGIVTHGLTGAPILRAHVLCDGLVSGKPQQFGAMTDAEGKYSIKGLPPGSYSVSVERVGFVTSARVQVALRPDSTPEVKFKLTPTGAILGRVLDHEGDPVEGVAVYAQNSAGNRQPVTATTDHTGRYRIGGLTPGRYRIRVHPQSLQFGPEISTDGHEDARYIATYHPGNPDRKSATRLGVHPGADLNGIDVRLLRAPMVRITGVVTGIPAGTPPNSIAIEPRGMNLMARTQLVGPDGKFEIWNLDPGKWALTAVLYRDQTRSAPVEIEVGTQHIGGLELRLIPSFEVAGQAQFEDDSAKPRPQTPGGPPPRWSLQEVNRLGGTRGTQAIFMSEDGTFKFTNVPPGRYRVNIGWRATVKSVRLGPTEMENQILDLRSGTGGAPVTIVFGPATGEVTGIVRDDKGPVAGAVVVLRNPAIGIGSTNAAYTVTTGADGAFRFSNLASGRYILVAPDAGETNPFSDSYDDYEDVLVELQVGAGEKISTDLKRHPAGR